MSCNQKFTSKIWCFILWICILFCGMSFFSSITFADDSVVTVSESVPASEHELEHSTSADASPFDRRLILGFSLGGEMLAAHDFYTFDASSNNNHDYLSLGTNTYPVVNIFLQYAFGDRFRVGATFVAAFSGEDNYYLNLLFTQDYDILKVHKFTITAQLGVGYSSHHYVYSYDDLQRQHFFIIQSAQIKESLMMGYQINPLFMLGVSAGVSEYIGRGKITDRDFPLEKKWYGDFLLGVSYELVFRFSL